MALRLEASSGAGVPRNLVVLLRRFTESAKAPCSEGRESVKAGSLFTEALS